MAEDRLFTEPQAPEHDAAVEGAAEKQPAKVETHQDPVVDTAPEADEPQFDVSLAADADLEAPVYVSVPGLHTDVEPLPHPDDIKDDDGEFLPGYDEDTPTLVKTEDGWERPEDAPQSEAVAPLDEHGRLELSDSPVTVPASVARVLEGLPYVKIEEARS